MSKWEMVNVMDLLKDYTSKVLKLNSDLYLKIGKYPIVDQGSQYICGYSNIESEKIGISDTVILFGDHTRNIKFVDFQCYIGADGVKYLTQKTNDNCKYIYYMLTYRPVINTGYNRHFKYFKELTIPLPPLQTQQKIAKTLDLAQSLIDARKEQIKLLDELAKSTFCKMFGDPVTNPMGWEVMKLKDLSNKITDGVHQKPNYTAAGKPFISVKNISKGFLNFSDCMYVSEDDYTKMAKSTNAEKNDILYTKVGATYGISVVNNSDIKFGLYVSVCLIKPKHDVINFEFLNASMNHPYIKRQADKRVRGIGVPDLHLNQIREFDIIIPPFELQIKYAEFVKFIEAQKATLQSSLTQLENNFNCLMQKAFKGELFD